MSIRIVPRVLVQELYRQRLILRDCLVEFQKHAGGSVPDTVLEDLREVLSEMRRKKLYTEFIEKPDSVVAELEFLHTSIEAYRKKYFTQYDWDVLRANSYIESGLKEQLYRKTVSDEVLAQLATKPPRVIEHIERIVYGKRKMPWTGVLESFLANVASIPCSITELLQYDRLDEAEVKIREVLIRTPDMPLRQVVKDLVVPWIYAGHRVPAFLLDRIDCSDAVNKSFEDMFFALQHRYYVLFKTTDLLYGLILSGKLAQVRHALEHETYLPVNYERLLVAACTGGTREHLHLYRSIRKTMGTKYIRYVVLSILDKTPCYNAMFFREIFRDIRKLGWPWVDIQIHSDQIIPKVTNFDDLVIVRNLLVLHNNKFDHACAVEQLFKPNTHRDELTHRHILLTQFQEIEIMSKREGDMFNYTELFAAAVYLDFEEMAYYMLERIHDYDLVFDLDYAVTELCQYCVRNDSADDMVDRFIDILRHRFELISMESDMLFDILFYFGNIESNPLEYLPDNSPNVVKLLNFIASTADHLDYSCLFRRMSQKKKFDENIVEYNNTLLVFQWCAARIVAEGKQPNYTYLCNNETVNDKSNLKMWARSQLLDI